MKKIISFSLYGSDQKYTIGMLCNVELSLKIYPDWICRIYYDETIDQNFIDKLTHYNHVELINMSNFEPKIFKMIWRFLAIDDDDVEIMLSRDSDARLSYREKKSVDIFMESESILHSIRDNPSHNDIMGGLWGIKKNNRIKIKDLLIRDNCFTYDCDQIFLRTKIVPYFNDSYMIHCSTYLNNYPVKKENEYFVGGWWYADNFGKPIDHVFF